MRLFDEELVVASQEQQRAGVDVAERHQRRLTPRPHQVGTENHRQVVGAHQVDVASLHNLGAQIITPAIQKRTPSRIQIFPKKCRSREVPGWKSPGGVQWQLQKSGKGAEGGNKACVSE